MNNNLKNIKKKELSTFAYIWALLFFIKGIIPLIKGGNRQIYYFVIAVFFLIIGIFYPQALSGLYRVLILVGNFVEKIISKIILFMLFYLLFTPIGLMAKLFGKDFLNKKLNKNSPTYWEPRKIQPYSMKNQF